MSESTSAVGRLFAMALAKRGGTVSQEEFDEAANAWLDNLHARIRRAESIQGHEAYNPQEGDQR